MSMKKKVLCFFSLVLYLLAACTMLSEKIEEEMTTLVQIDFRKAAGSFDPTSQSMDSLFTDEAGQHLYEVVDGAGWESGLRIREIPEGVWSLAYARNVYVEVPGGENYRFITSASRQPPEGGLVKIVEKFKTGEDRYLVIYPDTVPEILELPENTEISAQDGNTLLLDMKKAQFPFFEHSVKKLSDAMGAADRIFSLTEVELFLKELPAAAMTALLILAALILWGYSCLLSAGVQVHRGLLGVNALLILASLGAMHPVLGSIDFPASLLPSGSILDWRHYADTLSCVFSALEALGDTAQPLMELKTQMFTQSAQILYCGLGACLALIFGESLLLWIKALWKRRKKRYVGKYLAPGRGTVK